MLIYLTVWVGLEYVRLVVSVIGTEVLAVLALGVPVVETTLSTVPAVTAIPALAIAGIPAVTTVPALTVTTVPATIVALTTAIATIATVIVPWTTLWLYIAFWLIGENLH